MKAGIFTRQGVIDCYEVDMPEKKQSEVLIRTLRASICGSDLHVGYCGWGVDDFPLPPGFPGHESVCEVVDGEGTNYVENQLVLAVPIIPDARSFSEYQVIPESQLIKIGDSISMNEMLMAQQLGTVIFALRKLPDLSGQSVVIIGQGSAGLFHTFMCKRLNADKIISIDPIALRCKISKELGADIVINSKEEYANKEIMEITQGLGSDIVIDAVGSVDTLNQSIQIAKPDGNILLFGLPTTETRVSFDWSTMFKKSLSIKAIHGSQHEKGLPDFKLACELIESKEIDVSNFVTHVFELEDIQKAFDLVENKQDGVIKAAIRFD
ncbi:MAG: zinc-binding dehydrogenase [SAR202 cluster bacterium]|nr:zinc-binding dehydrogenase [SAR202 cluster bacterium]